MSNITMLQLLVSCKRLFSSQSLKLCPSKLWCPPGFVSKCYTQCLGKAINTQSILTFSRTLHATSVLKGIIPFKLSDIGEGIKEVEIKEWYIGVGDTVAQFDSICEVQSDKASVTITSRYDGVIKNLHYAIGEIAQVGETLVDIDVVEETEVAESVPENLIEDSSVTSEVKAPTPTPTPTQILSESDKTKVLATPAVRKIAKDNNINLSTVKGSGEKGRILKEDLLKIIEPSEEIVRPPSVSALAADQVEPIKGIRKAMMTSMNASLLIPHFGYDDEYDMNALVDMRYLMKKQVKNDHGIKLSFMPFIIKATSLALLKYPILNSQIDIENENLIYKADHNIGIATDTPHGLLLPCIKQVQQLSILEIASELNRLHEAGLNNKISPNDVAGGTFSLSNIGNIGGTYARPVIFPPQVAIGALGRIQALPRFDYDGNVVKKNIMCVSWSGDHRVIEGATMARFSNLLKDYLENPSKMLMYLK